LARTGETSETIASQQKLAVFKKNAASPYTQTTNDI